MTELHMQTGCTAWAAGAPDTWATSAAMATAGTAVVSAAWIMAVNTGEAPGAATASRTSRSSTSGSRLSAPSPAVASVCLEVAQQMVDFFVYGRITNAVNAPCVSRQKQASRAAYGQE